MIELVERNLRYLVEYDSLAPHCRQDASLVETAALGDGRTVLTEERRYGRVRALSGTWDGVTPDDASNVYVLSGGALYEAVPRPDGFIVSLPDGVNDRRRICGAGNFSRPSPSML